MKIISNLERSPWKLAPGALADTDTAHGNVTQATQTQPGVECASFAIDPKGKEFANAYWYKELGADARITQLDYSVAFLFPTPHDSQACQALELDLQQVLGGTVYNFGIQLDFAEGFVRLWNRAEHEAKREGWISIGKPIGRWAAGQWLEIELKVRRDIAKSRLVYESMHLSGEVVPLGGVAYPSVKLNLPNMLNCAVQLDGNSRGEAYRVMVDAVGLQLS